MIVQPALAEDPVLMREQVVGQLLDGITGPAHH
jgi:hypothetical protein